MSKVFFKKAAYDYATLKPTVFDMLEAAGKDCIQRQARVLIKPNLLLPAKPEKAILTHPLIVRAVVEYVLAKGGRPQISDSQAIGSFARILKDGGYKKTFEGLDVEFKPFENSLQTDIGEPFGKIDIAVDAVEADIVINLAKLKTHSQMLLTLGVKNLFGCIVGYRKPEWHFRSGVDRDMFARLLVQIYNAVRPAITVIDGIMALEGQGPGKSGTPRHLGIIAAGCHAPSIDLAICKMLELDPLELPTHKAALKLGLVGKTVVVEGDFFKINDFKFPVLGNAAMGPRPFHKFMRRHILQKPVADSRICKLCGDCWHYCPAKAIEPSKTMIQFYYEQCIRCYCCIEVCPHGALRAVEPLPGKLFRKAKSVWNKTLNR